MLRRLQAAIDSGDLQVINMHKDGDGPQVLELFKRPVEKVLRELVGDLRLAGHQHFAFHEYKDPHGNPFNRPFLVKSLWSKLWSCAKRGCRNPGREALKLFGAGMCRLGKRGLLLRNKCSWYRISYTISYPISYTIFITLSSISNTRMTYDIGYDKLQLELRYRSFFIPIS